jgi:hypothetical protein
MNKLLREAGRILDLDPHQYVSTIISEADKKEKLRNTYMFVNGKLEYVSKFYWNDNIIGVYNMEEAEATPVNVETLEPWLPLSGMYVSEDFSLYLTKRPHKHWRKSFSPDNYRLDFTSPITKAEVEKTMFTSLSTMTPELIAVSGDYIYLNGSIIGKKDKNEVVSCINYLFYQELLDFSNKKEMNWTIK